MSAVVIEPSKNPRMPDCGWCGLRLGQHVVYATPTCTECKAGGRTFRVKMGLQRLKRAAGAK